MKNIGSVENMKLFFWHWCFLWNVNQSIWNVNLSAFFHRGVFTCGEGKICVLLMQVNLQVTQPENKCVLLLGDPGKILCL